MNPGGADNPDQTIHLGGPNYQLTAARVLRAPTLTQLVPTIVRIDNASLASQAVVPPLSDREMGSLGRTFRDVGKRLASAVPLKHQQVAWTDSVLAPYVDYDGRG